MKWIRALVGKAWSIRDSSSCLNFFVFPCFHRHFAGFFVPPRRAKSGLPANKEGFKTPTATAKVLNEFAPLASDFLDALLGSFNSYYRKNVKRFRVQFDSEAAHSVSHCEACDAVDCCGNHIDSSSELRDSTYLVVGDLLQTLSVAIDCSRHSLGINAHLSNLTDLISVTLDVPNTPHLRYW